MAEETKQPARTSTIHLTIGLNSNNIPETIHWEATDAEQGRHESSAMLMALWDQKAKTGLSIDLWTTEMTVPEMNLFFYQTFYQLSETFLRATQQKELSDDIQNFAKEFIEKVKKTEKLGL